MGRTGPALPLVALSSFTHQRRQHILCCSYLATLPVHPTVRCYPANKASSWLRASVAPLPMNMRSEAKRTRLVLCRSVRTGRVLKRKYL